MGKPISSLLSIPDQDMLAEVGANQESLPLEHSTAAVAQATEDGFQERILPQPKNRNAEDTTASQSRARAAASQETNSDMCLERLVAASGFGRCHVINVLAKPHHMLGRNVTVTKPSAAPQMRNREGVSNGSSITSGYDGPYHAVPCSMSVSPVVSSPEAFNVAVVTDKDQDNHHHKTKRRKHHHHSDSQQLASNAHRRLFLMREVSMHRKRHLITHYVIQLDTFEGNFRKLESHSSTSTTVEAHILGLTKSELRRVRTNTQVAAPPAPAEGTDRPLGEEEDDEMESEFSEPREPVTAIG